GVLVVGAGAAGLIVTHGHTSTVHLAGRPSTVAAPDFSPVPNQTAQAPGGQSGVTQPALPVKLTIPAIGARAPFIHLGLQANGSLQVPATTTVVGWYTGSPRPGAVGGSVVAGHVDSTSGPGIFYWLRDLKPDDKVYISRADGTVAEFDVTRVQEYPKSAFPTSVVYGPAPDAELRLITCGGTFDSTTGHYLSIVIAYASLVQ
ncbi:MAG TPA: class F sortase, partial [Streptosporangiaceae bacterium]|nr:class F sortase [Streptosporangiaceae bacterium]